MHAALIAATARAKREREHQLWLEQELSLRPDDVAARCALARVLAERGDIDRAIAELGRISAPMAGLEVQALRGRLLLRGAREQEALAAFAALLDTLERAEAGEGIA
jgi:predicted negative regulator of RcsB-dependent stress response